MNNKIFYELTGRDVNDCHSLSNISASAESLAVVLRSDA